MNQGPSLVVWTVFVTVKRTRQVYDASTGPFHVGDLGIFSLHELISP